MVQKCVLRVVENFGKVRKAKTGKRGILGMGELLEESRVGPHESQSRKGETEELLRVVN